MKRSTDRILTTHVGSLIRPQALQEIMRAKQGGQTYDQAAYETCLKESVADVVGHQAEVGVDVISDGEYGKAISWNQYVIERLSGFELRAIPAGLPARGRRARTARASRNSMPSSTCASRWPTPGWSPASAR